MLPLSMVVGKHYLWRYIN